MTELAATAGAVLFSLAALSPLLLVRALLSLVAAPLLYRALGEPGQGWTGGAAAMARRAFFALLGAVVLFSLTARWQPEKKSPDMGRGFQAFMLGTYLHRLTYSPLGGVAVPTASGDPKMNAVTQLRQAADRVPESAYFRRYLGLVLADEGDYPGALQALDRATTLLAQRAPDAALQQRAARERAIWHAVFGPRLPSRREMVQAQQALEEWKLGWIGRVGVQAAYRRLGKDAVPPELATTIRREAAGDLERILLLEIEELLIVPQLGLIALVVGIVLYSTGVWPREASELHPVSAILWESFILMMALGLTPVFSFFHGRRPVPETQPGAVSVLFLLQDLTEVVALIYLWWRLRSRKLTLAEIGLTTRKLPRNLFFGAMGASIVMPSVVVIGLLTQRLTDRFFPNVAPPYHPLNGLTATSSSDLIRLALFFAAAIGAPFFEEIFFRGVLYGSLRRRFGFWPALLGSSAFFAILHPQLPLGFLPIALLGAAFCVLYEWRGSLIPGMVAHSINNGLIFLTLSAMFPLRP